VNLQSDLNQKYYLTDTVTTDHFNFSDIIFVQDMSENQWVAVISNNMLSVYWDIKLHSLIDYSLCRDNFISMTKLYDDKQKNDERLSMISFQSVSTSAGSWWSAQ